MYDTHKKDHHRCIEKIGIECIVVHCRIHLFVSIWVSFIARADKKLDEMPATETMCESLVAFASPLSTALALLLAFPTVF
jgi:hypothetical protein